MFILLQLGGFATLIIYLPIFVLSLTKLFKTCNQHKTKPNKPHLNMALMSRRYNHSSRKDDKVTQSMTKNLPNELNRTEVTPVAISPCCTVNRFFLFFFFSPLFNFSTRFVQWVNIRGERSPLSMSSDINAPGNRWTDAQTQQRTVKQTEEKKQLPFPLFSS